MLVIVESIFSVVLGKSRGASTGTIEKICSSMELRPLQFFLVFEFP
jgi:hypothetical protein